MSATVCNYPRESLRKSILFRLELILTLQPHPEFRGVLKEAGQQQRGLGRNGALAVNDGMNPTHVNADRLGETVLCYAQGSKKFFVKYLPGMNGGKLGFT